MRKTLARIVAGVALTAGLIGFGGMATAAADDFDSNYREPASSGKPLEPSDLPSSVDMYNNFNAAGGEIGHGVATGVSSAYFGAPIAAAEFFNGVAEEALEYGGLEEGGLGN